MPSVFRKVMNKFNGIKDEACKATNDELDNIKGYKFDKELAERDYNKCESELENTSPWSGERFRKFRECQGKKGELKDAKEKLEYIKEKYAKESPIHHAICGD